MYNNGLAPAKAESLPNLQSRFISTLHLLTKRTQTVHRGTRQLLLRNPLMVVGLNKEEFPKI